MPFDDRLLARFHRALVREIQRRRPRYLDAPFSIEEIYRDLVPYRTHRNVIGVAMNGDYEDALLRLLGGEGDFLVVESPVALREIRKELRTPNPDTSRFRQFASASVRLNPEALGALEREGRAKADEADPVPSETLVPDASAAGSSAQGPDAPTPTAPAAPEPTPGPTSGVEPDEGSAPSPSPGLAAAAEADRIGEELADGPVRARVEPGEAPSQAVAPDDPRTAPPTAPPAPASIGASMGAPDTRTETCEWCSEALPDREGMNFCPHCGGCLKLVLCPACGEGLEPTWRFCVVCGVEIRVHR